MDLPNYTTQDAASYKASIDYIIKTLAERFVSASPTTTYIADYDNGNLFALTLGGNTAITLSNIPAVAYGYTTTITFILIQDATGSRVPSFPASVKWDSGDVPIWGTASGNEDVVSMFTMNGGITWRANLVGRNYA